MSEYTKGPWSGGNEAIKMNMDRAKPWASTIFDRRHDGTDAAALVGIVFGATPEEAAATAKSVAAMPELLDALERVTANAQALLDFAERQCEFEGCSTAIEADIAAARAAILKATQENSRG